MMLSSKDEVYMTKNYDEKVTDKNTLDCKIC